MWELDVSMDYHSWQTCYLGPSLAACKRQARRHMCSLAFRAMARYRIFAPAPRPKELCVYGAWHILRQRMVWRRPDPGWTRERLLAIP